VFTGTLSVPPASMFVHVPATMMFLLQVWHVAQDAVEQQTPSTHDADKQSPFSVQATPRSSLHVLAPLHEPLVHSLSGSKPVAMTPHVPSVPEPFFAAVQA
jgi:hypothetical protein